MPSPDEIPREPGRRFAQFSAFQQQILWAVETADDRPIGQDVSDTLEDWRDEEVTTSRLYTNLADLVEADLLHKRNRGRACEYSLTEKAATAIESYDEYVLPSTDGDS